MADPQNSSRRNLAALAAIVLASAVLGMLVHWRAPGLDLYARDGLMRARGPLAAPDDIAIVAIDESSIARFGRFPWPRTLTAQALDRLTAAQPKAIAIDVLYTDATNPADDAALAKSIAQAGNVVVAAQLVDAAAPGGETAWLLPLAPIAQAAAGVGHVNVSTEAEGVGRQLLVREADDAGRSFRAMAVEAVRVADRTPDSAVTDTPGGLLIGKRFLPAAGAGRAVVVAGRGQMLHAARMTIDYIGPAGAFASRTYSFADVVDGRVPEAAFRGRYVLVGATAASLGDRLASPFVHQTDVRQDQHGALMPGVEVLANSLNTILRSRFYSDTPDWLAFLAAALAAAITLALLAVAQGRYEAFKQCTVLAGVGAGIVVTAYLVFTRSLLFPPIVPATAAFASAGVLGLLRRSLSTSAQLDTAIAEASRADAALAPEGGSKALAESVAQLTGAAGVAIFAQEGEGRYRLAASAGLPVLARYQQAQPAAVDFSAAIAARFFQFNGASAYDTLLLPLEPGMLVVSHAAGAPPATEPLRLATALAAAACQQTAPPTTDGWLPRGVEWKARALGGLNRRVVERSRFVDLALRSVEDGLLIASADGRITFANPRAAGILGATAESLVGRDLLVRLAEAERGSAAPDSERRDLLARLILDRTTIEREIVIRGVRPRHYTLRVAAVASQSNGSGTVLGLVASLSDVTRQHELQQTKNDVVALVSHEMRTPLTAIQGMSELLAQYDMDPARRREMYLAINEEAKRLARMTSDYLDIARLESGASTVRKAPVQLEALVDRALLLHDPLAAAKNILLLRDIAPGGAPLLADADLVTRAIGNLVSNAIKYSPRESQVRVTLRRDEAGATIEVADQGYGIPEKDWERIFEKFYRVPRVEDAGTPGTGLGLALVREIAELHGGSVSVHSAVNKGSVFTLRIPDLRA